MAAGDINDPLSQIPGIALADDSTDPTDLGSGYALLKFKSGQLIWLPTGGSLTRALDDLTPGQVHAITEKASPVAADVLLIEDSAASWAKKRVPWSALPGASAVTDVDWSGTLTLTQSGAVAKTVDYARYALLGNLVLVSVAMHVTGSGTGANDIVVGGLPAAANMLETSHFWGLGAGIVEKGGGIRYDAMVTPASATSFMFFHGLVGAAIGGDPNIALASGDFISFVAAFPHA